MASSSDSTESQSAWNVFKTNEVVEAYEDRIQDGDRISIETALQVVPTEHWGEVLVELIETDIEWEERIPGTIDPDGMNGYIRRFPQYRNVIEDLFDKQQYPLAAPSPISGSSGIGGTQYERWPEVPGYAIKERLGDKSGQAEVFVATSQKPENPGELVAIKVLKGRYRPLEKDILEKLKHPGIVRLLDHTETADGRLVLVMKLISGGNLKKHLDECGGKLDEAEAVRLVSTIVETLVHVHQRGILHLDLKPQNILLERSVTDGSMVPLLADFGLSVVRQSNSTSSAPRGTIKYMPPEQFGKDFYSCPASARSDLFSIGMILYRLLTPHDPFWFDGEEDWHNLGKVHARLWDRSPESLRSYRPELSQQLDDLCLKCIEPDPRHRYSSAAQLLQALRNLQHKPEASIPPGILSLQPLTAEADGFYRSLLKAAAGSRLGEQIETVLQRILPRDDLKSTTETPAILALSAPSGAGKSTWLHAGLMPQLREKDTRSDVTVVFVNAEERNSSKELDLTAELLRKKLIFHLSVPPSDSETQTSLTDILSMVAGGSLAEAQQPRQQRRRQPKVLIVIDQFEQWLSVHGRSATTELRRALKHANGTNLQVLLIFRREFLEQAEDFMDACGSPRRHNDNGFRLEPLTGIQAGKVLEYILDTAVPNLVWHNDDERRKALEHAARLLSDIDSNAVLPAWIIIIARFLARHSDSPRQLLQKTSFADVAQSHLADIFKNADVPAAQSTPLFSQILREFIPPETAEELRPAPASESQISSACGRNPANWELRRALDHLCSHGLIMQTQEAADSSEQSCWQLAHEVWINPIRRWLRSSILTETEDRLRSRSTSYGRTGESRYLLSVFEFIETLRFVPRIQRQKHADFLRKSLRSILKNLLSAGLLTSVIPVWITGNFVSNRSQISSFDSRSSIQEIAEAPWYLDPWVNHWIEAEFRQRGGMDSPGKVGAEDSDLWSTLPLRLAMIWRLPAEDPRLDTHFSTIISTLDQVPPRIRDDIANVFISRREKLLPLAVRQLEKIVQIEDPERRANLCANHALLFLCLQQPALANDALLKFTEDHSARVLFVRLLSGWLSSGSVQKCLNPKELYSCPEVLNGILAALYDQQSPAPVYADLVKSVYPHPFAKVASPAWHLARKWRITLPNQQQGLTEQGEDWMIENGLFLIRLTIPPDTLSKDDHPAKRIFVSATEVAVRHMKQDPEFAPVADASEDLPAVMLSHDDIFEFCNLLSRNSGRTEVFSKPAEQPAEQPAETPAEQPAEKPWWVALSESDGYRLPLSSEYVVLAGRGMAFRRDPVRNIPGDYISDDVRREEIPRYSLTKGGDILASGEGQPKDVASLRPDSLGFFDVTGNVKELILLEGGDGTPANNLVFYEGDFGSSAMLRIDPTGTFAAPPEPEPNIGFRVVRNAD
jgi:serine/threonine protein kinase